MSFPFTIQSRRCPSPQTGAKAFSQRNSWTILKGAKGNSLLKHYRKRGLYIIDLEALHAPPKLLSHLTKWEVSDVQWNPHPQKENWIASTVITYWSSLYSNIVSHAPVFVIQSNQKVLIWNIETKNSHVEHILQAHKRAVSDLHWSPFHPELIATCSYDAYIHLWDMRIANEKPSNSFCAWTAAASQVKFNRLNENLFASSHDTDVRVWDIRKGSSPLTLITAHMKKIYGIDWSRNQESELVTCSQDGLVKVSVEGEFINILITLYICSAGIIRSLERVSPQLILDRPFGERGSHHLGITWSRCLRGKTAICIYGTMTIFQSQFSHFLVILMSLQNSSGESVTMTMKRLTTS